MKWTSWVFSWIKGTQTIESYSLFSIEWIHPTPFRSPPMHQPTPWGTRVFGPIRISSWLCGPLSRASSDHVELWARGSSVLCKVGFRPRFCESQCGTLNTKSWTALGGTQVDTTTSMCCLCAFFRCLCFAESCGFVVCSLLLFLVQLCLSSFLSFPYCFVVIGS